VDCHARLRKLFMPASCAVNTGSLDQNRKIDWSCGLGVGNRNSVPRGRLSYRRISKLRSRRRRLSTKACSRILVAMVRSIIHFVCPCLLTIFCAASKRVSNFTLSQTMSATLTFSGTSRGGRSNMARGREITSQESTFFSTCSQPNPDSTMKSVSGNG
jgi:hypothetical protein